MAVLDLIMVLALFLVRVQEKPELKILHRFIWNDDKISIIFFYYYKNKTELRF